MITRAVVSPAATELHPPTIGANAKADRAEAGAAEITIAAAAATISIVFILVSSKCLA